MSNMNFDEIRNHPLWEKILVAVDKTVDNSRQQVITAAEREPLERVRFLAGQHAGVSYIRDYLRGL